MRQKQPPVGAVLGHVAERSGAVFISDPGPSMKKKSPSGKKKGWGCTTGPAFQAEIEEFRPFLNMDRRFLCGINRVHADVAGQ